MSEEYARGWIRLENNMPNPVELFLEPWAWIVCQLQSGETVDVWLEPYTDHKERPVIVFSPENIVLWADLNKLIVWSKGECVHYWGDDDLPPTPPAR